MKKISIIISLLLAITGAGCGDFLNLVPKNKKIVGNVEDVKAELFAYLSSLTYSYSLTNPSFGTASFRFPFYNDVAGQLCLYEDDIDMTHFSDHADVDDDCRKIYDESVDWKGVNLSSNLWGSCYSTIGFMNNIIDDLIKVGGYSEAEYETIVGEAKVIRAYHVFKLLQFFAPYDNDKLGIPLNFDSENVEPSKRWSQRAVYQKIVDELTEVLEFKTGPEKWNIFYQPEIVKALLAQMYWFKAGSAAAEASDWEKAEMYSSELLGNYVLENEVSILAEIFSPAVKEYTLLNPNYLLRFSYSQVWGYGSKRTGFWASGNAQRVSSDLLALYGENDIRLQAWFKHVEDNGEEYYGINKPAYAYPISEITVLFRSAELYLINAEAHYRLSDLPKARAMIEDFKRARQGDFDAFADDRILDEILVERRKEFCYEGGSRWLDMKRLGIQVGRRGVDKEGEGTKMYNLEADDYRYALPIPSGIELDYNKIEQNPGWGNLN